MLPGQPAYPAGHIIRMCAHGGKADALPEKAGAKGTQNWNGGCRWRHPPFFIGMMDVTYPHRTRRVSRGEDSPSVQGMTRTPYTWFPLRSGV